MGYYYEDRTQQVFGQDIKAEAYRHLGLSFLLSTLVVAFMVFLEVPLLIYMIGAIGEFVIIIVLFLTMLFVRNISETTAMILLYSFVICSSITLSLLVLIGLSLDPLIVVCAVGATTVVMLAAYLFSGKTYQRINQISKVMLIIVILFLVFTLIGFFIFSGDPLFYLIISVISALIFAVYTFLDFARLENRAFHSPALMALWLFYDVIYLLKNLLMIFILVNRRRD